jgi:hypothetical protein
LRSDSISTLHNTCKQQRAVKLRYPENRFEVSLQTETVRIACPLHPDHHDISRTRFTGASPSCNHPRDSLMRRSVTLRIRVTRTHTVTYPPFTSIISLSLTTSMATHFLYIIPTPATTSLVLNIPSIPFQRTENGQNYTQLSLFCAQRTAPLPKSIQTFSYSTTPLLFQPVRFNAATLRLT